MKSNFIKYIFIIFVIGLVIYAAYILYGGQDNNIDREKEIDTVDTEPMIYNIRIPVVNFDTINPILSNNVHVQNISKLIYEPLLTITEDYKVELCLAKEWTKVNQTSYVIKLKDGIKWSDGNSLTAKDVQYTIDRIKEVNSIYSYSVREVISVEVIDDSTVKINLSKEVPFFEYNLIFPILSQKYYENEDFINTDKNNAPVGTGQFKVINDNGKITLKQNENWWNKQEENSKLEEIQIVKYSNMGEVYKAFKIGNIDIVSTESLEIENYIGTIGYNTKEYKGRKIDFLAFNCNNEELAKQEVRKAIAYAIDKQNIIASIFKR